MAGRCAERRLTVGRLAAAILALGLLAVCLAAGIRERVSARRATLAAAPRSTLPVEARLFGGFRYAPYVPVRASAAPPPAVTEEEAPAEDLADLGVSKLLGGNPGEAVAWLEAAVRHAPEDARHWSDLAAALLERAAAEDDTHDVVRGLTAALRALAREPGLPEALFNRALALERLSLRSEAVAAWKAYLEQDPKGGWAAEAKARLQALERPTLEEFWDSIAQELDRAAAAPPDIAAVRRIVGEFPQQARERAEKRYLPDWAEAFRNGRSGVAARALLAARTVGDALASHGESMTADGVAAIDVALASPADRALAEVLADGHFLLSEGWRLRDVSHETTRARVLLDTAAERLRAGKSPFSAWADYVHALCDYDESRMESSRSIIDPLAAQRQAERYPSLAGQIAWLSGLIRLRSADPSAALADYENALHLFKQSREEENIGAVHVLFADAFKTLGDDREAWRHRGLALSLLPVTSSPKRRQNLLEEVERVVKEEDAETALSFRAAAVAEAKRSGDPLVLSFALLRRASLRHRSGDDPGAWQDLDDAASRVLRIPSEQQRSIQAELALTEGEVALENNPRHAIDRFSAALAFFTQIGDRMRQVEVHIRRARAERAVGDAVSADEDLKAGLAGAEQQWPRLDREDLRESYFASMQPIFDLRIAFAVDHGDKQKGLDLAERARARGLLDQVGRQGAQPAEDPLTWDRLQRRLPPGVAVVEYAVLEDRLWAWVIRAHGDVTTFTAPAAGLARQVEDLRSAITGGVDSPGVRDLSERLYAELVKPALAGSEAGETLIFVPDKFLHDLPFAALRAGDHLLVTDHPIGVTPSASLWVRALDRDRELATPRSPSALLVGDPAFDEKSFPGLDRLPEARQEIEEIAPLYPPGATLKLLDKDATRQRVLAEMGRFGVLHIAGHSQINAQEPRRSRLALAPSPGDSGVLYAGDLENLRLDRPRLAILAACSTGLQETQGGEGVSGLTHAFLGAGIPAVVASLWDVRDARGTARLLTEMHRSLLQGASPYSALRAAQRALLADPDTALHNPRIWAAFQVFGGAVPDRPASFR